MYKLETVFCIDRYTIQYSIHYRIVFSILKTWFSFTHIGKELIRLVECAFKLPTSFFDAKTRNFTWPNERLKVKWKIKSHRNPMSDRWRFRWILKQDVCIAFIIIRDYVRLFKFDNDKNRNNFYHNNQQWTNIVASCYRIFREIKLFSRHANQYICLFTSKLRFYPYFYQIEINQIIINLFISCA